MFASLIALALIAPADAPPCPAACDPAPLTRDDAILTALRNSEILRVAVASPDAEGGPVVVVRPLNADAAPERLKAELMALVRSVEQQYWALWYEKKALDARVEALEAVEAIAREQPEKGSDPAEIAETREWLERGRLDVNVATADVATTVRQLRNILGLPADPAAAIRLADTPAEHVDLPDSARDLATMLVAQPDVALLRRVVAEVEGGGCDAADPALARNRACLQEAIRQGRFSLVRMTQSIESGEEQYRAAIRSREASERRVDTSREAYRKGQMTCDRYLAAIMQLGAARVAEAQFHACYATSLAGMDEARGTLLETKGIVVAGPEKARDLDATPKRDDEARQAEYRNPGSYEVRVSKGKPPGPYWVRVSFGGKLQTVMQAEKIRLTFTGQEPIEIEVVPAPQR